MCKKIFLITLFFGFHNLSVSENTLDTNDLMEKIYIAYELEQSNSDSAYKLAKSVLNKSSQSNYLAGIAYASMRLGSILDDKGNKDSALAFFQDAYSIRKQLKDYKGASGACNEIAYVFKDLGQIEKSFQYLFESLRLSELSNDSVAIALSMNEIGVLKEFYGDNSSISFFEKALDISKAIHFQQGIANSYGNFGLFYFNKSEFKKAQRYFSKALILQLSLGDNLNAARNYANIGLCKFNLGELQSSIYNYSKAKEIYTQLGLTIDKAKMYNNIGDMYWRIGEADSALLYLNYALKLFPENNHNNRQETFFSMSKTYAQLGDYESAYLKHMLYAMEKDSVLNAEKVSSISEMQTKYETEKKEQQIALLDEQNKTQQAERNYILASSAVLLLLLLISGVYYYQRSRIAIKNEKIAQQELEATIDEQDIKTYNAMLEGQEEERMRIATDLHDRLGSMLSTVKLLFSSLEEKFDKAQEENQQQYAKANHLLDDACVEIRRISHNLGTGMVANFGLKRAIEELCESVDQSGKINCKALVYGIEKGTPLAIETGIYRMVQEGFNNAIKHAKADNLTVQLNKLEDGINVTIEDDGVGFDLEKQRKSDGMGLSNLEKRAKKLGGELHIDTKKGRGTTIIIDLPLNLQA